MSIPIFESPLDKNLEAAFYDLAVKSGIFVPIDDKSFRYKNYMIVRGPDNTWNVFYLKPSKKIIAKTFLKISSFAICKAHEKNLSARVKEIEDEDKKFKKNYIDSVFYKNTYKVTSDAVKKDTALWRYEIVYNRAKESKTRIDQIFYGSLA